MWTLGRLLPVMIGHIIPEDNPHWLHYSEVLDTMDLYFSPFVCPQTPGYLKVLIEQNLQAFQDLYPDSSILPKMHFQSTCLISSPSLHCVLCFIAICCDYVYVYIHSLGPLVRH